MPSLPSLNLGRRGRLALRIVGYVALALVTFVFALQLTFPYNRVKDKLVEAMASKYDVTISSVERGLIPGRVYFNAVTLRTRPAKSDEVASTFFIKRLEVDMGILSLFGGNASVYIDAEIGPGRIRGDITVGKSATVLDIEGIDLPSAMLPMREAIGLPMSGKIAFAVDVRLPNEKQKTGKTTPNWQKAGGTFQFACPTGCVFGDGKTKLKPKLKNSRSQAFAADGIDFGKISVNTMLAHVTIKDGILELDKFDAKSEDGELHVDFQVTLAPSFDDGMVAGCLRFKGSEALQKKEPRTSAALATTGANMGPDGLFHIRLDGRFKEMKRLAQTCGPALKGGNMDDPGGTHNNSGPSRPNLTVQPHDDGNGKDANNRDNPTPAPGLGADAKPLPSINPPPPTATADAGVAPPGPVGEQNNGHNPTPENIGSGSAGSGSSGSGAVQVVPPGEPLPPGGEAPVNADGSQH